MVRQLTDAECEPVRSEIRALLASRPDLSMTDITSYTTLAESTGRQFLCGNIPGGREVISEYKRVLAFIKAGDILQPGSRTGAKALLVAEDSSAPARRVARRRAVYETQTIKRVAEVLDYCAEQAAIGVITADFGAGKTEAVRHWRGERARKTPSVVVEFDEFSCSNKVEAMLAIARVLGLDGEAGPQSGGKIFRLIIEHLREHPCLVIFDQCETVRVKVFQAIRQIWDRTSEYGVGMVLLGSPVLLRRMQVSRVEDLGALTSRVGIWAPLTGVTRAEMAAIIKQEGVADIEESAFELWWRATNGSMRRLMRALDLVKAKHTGKRITEKTISGVAGHLWGIAFHQEPTIQ